MVGGGQAPDPGGDRELGPERGGRGAAARSLSAADYRWRQEFRRDAADGAKSSGFLPVEVVPERETDQNAPELCRSESMIEVVLMNGRIVRFGSDLGAAVLRRLVGTLEEA